MGSLVDHFSEQGRQRTAFILSEKRSDSLAICQAASGLAGFAATLTASPLIASIQTNGNSLFGMHLYAQQVVSGIAFVIVIAAIIYIRLFVVENKQDTRCS